MTWVQSPELPDCSVVRFHVLSTGLYQTPLLKSIPTSHPGPRREYFVRRATLSTAGLNFAGLPSRTPILRPFPHRLAQHFLIALVASSLVHRYAVPRAAASSPPWLL